MTFKLGDLVRSRASHTTYGRVTTINPNGGAIEIEIAKESLPIKWSSYIYHNKNSKTHIWLSVDCIEYDHTPMTFDGENPEYTIIHTSKPWHHGNGITLNDLMEKH